MKIQFCKFSKVLSGFLFVSTILVQINLSLSQQSVYQPNLRVDVRVILPNGEPFDTFVGIPTNVNPINNPNAPGTHGVHRWVRGADRNKTNCNGGDNKYDYSEVQIDMNWFVNDPVLGLIDHSHNLAYWNHYYQDYDGPLQGSCDYSQNCHGFAFGVGDWPDHVWTLLNAYDGANSCHIGVSVKDATIATDPPYHSIIVTGAECDPVVLGAGCGGNGEPGLGLILKNFQWNWPTALPLTLIFAKLEQDPVPGDPHIGKEENFVSSSEQCRESGTYTQASPCEEGGIDINKAHARAGVVTYFFGIPVNGYRFFTYRPAGGEE